MAGPDRLLLRNPRLVPIFKISETALQVIYDSSVMASDQVFHLQFTYDGVPNYAVADRLPFINYHKYRTC